MTDYLQNPFIVNLVKDSAIDLIRFQSNPVKYRHPKLGLDWLFNFHRWNRKKMQM